jgi:hypothetical protein
MEAAPRLFTTVTPPATSPAAEEPVKRYESPTTKSPELIFSALLVENGARDVRFERTLCT